MCCADPTSLVTPTISAANGVGSPIDGEYMHSSAAEVSRSGLRFKQSTSPADLPSGVPHGALSSIAVAKFSSVLTGIGFAALQSCAILGTSVADEEGPPNAETTTATLLPSRVSDFAGILSPPSTKSCKTSFPPFLSVGTFRASLPSRSEPSSGFDGLRKTALSNGTVITSCPPLS